MTETTGDTPLHENIATFLRDQIRSGALAPGAQVPTERELAETRGASRSTVRLALNQLAMEGLVSSGRGRAGRVVRIRERLNWAHVVDDEDRRDGGAGAPAHGLDSFVQQAKEKGREPEEIVDVRIVAATEEYAAHLEVEHGTQLVLRKRIRTLEAQPTQISEGYYPLDLFEDPADFRKITHPGSIQEGVIALLARLGYPQTYFLDEILARMPDPVEAQELDIGIGVPVLVNQRIGYSQQRPVRLVRTIMPGDRHKLQYRLPA
jgi:GntR family transcriptional regulator